MPGISSRTSLETYFESSLMQAINFYERFYLGKLPDDEISLYHSECGMSDERSSIILNTKLFFYESFKSQIKELKADVNYFARSKMLIEGFKASSVMQDYFHLFDKIYNHA